MHDYMSYIGLRPLLQPLRSFEGSHTKCALCVSLLYLLLRFGVALC
jgi:hypothetical protein